MLPVPLSAFRPAYPVRLCDVQQFVDLGVDRLESGINTRRSAGVLRDCHLHAQRGATGRRGEAVGADVLRRHRQIDLRHLHRLRDVLTGDLQVASAHVAIEREMVGRALRVDIGRELAGNLGIRAESHPEGRSQACGLIDRGIGSLDVNVDDRRIGAGIDGSAER